MPRKAKKTSDNDIKVVFDKNEVKVKEETDDKPTAEDIEKWNLLGIKLLSDEEVAKLKNAKFKQYMLHLQRWNNCLETQLQFEEYKLKLLMDWHNGLKEESQSIDDHRKNCDDCGPKFDGKVGKELCQLDIEIDKMCYQIDTMMSEYTCKREAHKIKCAELEAKVEAAKKKPRKKPQPKKKSNKKLSSSDSETDADNDNKNFNHKKLVKSESETEMESNDGFETKTKKKVKSESEDEMDVDMECKKEVKSESETGDEYDETDVKKDLKSENETDYSSEDEKKFKQEIKVEKKDYESDYATDSEADIKVKSDDDLDKKANKPESKEISPIRRSTRSRK